MNIHTYYVLIFISFFTWCRKTRDKSTRYDFHNSTDTLKFWTEKQAINKKNVFHLILIKLGEIVVTHVNNNFTKFHQNRMKKKKVFIIARFYVQNFKVSVESWKSYIVGEGVGFGCTLLANLRYGYIIKWNDNKKNNI